MMGMSRLPVLHLELLLSGDTTMVTTYEMCKNSAKRKRIWKEDMVSNCSSCDKNQYCSGCIPRCNYCKTSIVDLHRSCPNCEFELCITCCKEIRENNLSCIEEALPLPNRGKKYMHGGYPAQRFAAKHENGDNSLQYRSKFTMWKADRNGKIYCPPKEVGGCGSAVLELKCMLPKC